MSDELRKQIQELECSSKCFVEEIAVLKDYAKREIRRAESNGKRAELFELKYMKLRAACESVLATAHGNTYGLTTEETLRAHTLAARDLELAVDEEEVLLLAEKYGFEPHIRGDQ